MRSKNNIVLKMLLAYTAALFVLNSAAQSLHLSVEKSSITFNENAVVTVTGEVKNLSSYAVLPEIDGLIVTDRTASFSLNKSNGLVKITQSFTLQPIRPGDFKIGPAYVETGSRRVYSNSADIHVEQTSGSNSGNIVFLRCEPNKEKVYIGEMITLTLRLYHRADINFSGDRPYAHSFSGFWYQEGSVDALYEDTVITADGLKYVGETLYKEYVFPNTTGDLYLPKYEYTCYVNFYGADANSLSSDQLVELVSAPVKITSLALPEHDSLPGYNGDVGQFNLSSSLSALKTKAWEPVTLNIIISGSGNFPFMMAPQLQLPTGVKGKFIEAFDSVMTLRNVYIAQKKFTYQLTPEKEGNFSLNEIKFSYFDPIKKEYVTRSVPGYTLEVAPGEKLQGDSENNLPSSFLEAKSNSTNLMIIALVIVVAFGSVGYYLYSENRKKAKQIAAEKEKETELESESIIETPVDKSRELAAAQLHSANLFLNNGQVKQCLNALFDATTIRICGVTRMRKEEISMHTLRYKLSMAKYSAETVNETLEVYENLKLKRYSVGAGEIETAKALAARTADLLGKLG